MVNVVSDCFIMTMTKSIRMLSDVDSHRLDPLNPIIIETVMSANRQQGVIDSGKGQEAC